MSPKKLYEYMLGIRIYKMLGIKIYKMLGIKIYRMLGYRCKHNEFPEQ